MCWLRTLDQQITIHKSNNLRTGLGQLPAEISVFLARTFCNTGAIRQSSEMTCLSVSLVKAWPEVLTEHNGANKLSVRMADKLPRWYWDGVGLDRSSARHGTAAASGPNGHCMSLPLYRGVSTWVGGCPSSSSGQAPPTRQSAAEPRLWRSFPT